MGPLSSTWTLPVLKFGLPLGNLPVAFVLVDMNLIGIGWTLIAGTTMSPKVRLSFQKRRTMTIGCTTGVEG